MKAYALSDIGRARPTNEDSYYIPEAGERFVCVADGMGGHKAGEVASAMAVREMAAALRRESAPDTRAFNRAFDEANRAIYEAAMADPDKKGMGTTLTALWFGDDTVYLAHVGDSRAYLLRNHALMQLSNDHSLVNELIERGQITPMQALTHPQRNFITRALGTDRHVEADVLRIDSQAGDVWLLCSDGLTNQMHSHEIAGILQNGEPNWPARLRALVDLALVRGGTDNITVVVAVVGEG